MKATHHKHRFHPRFEALEHRTVPTWIGAADGVLTVRGDEGPNVVHITDNGDGDLTVAVGFDRLPYYDITRIDAAMHGSGDQVHYTQDGNRTRSMDLNVELHDGRDMFTANIRGDILSGRTLDMDVKGGGGRDVLSVSATDDVDLRLGAVLRLNLEGGGSRDHIFASYRGKADGLIRLMAKGNDGNDRVTARVTAEAGSRGSLGTVGERARVEGNSDDDVLDFRVFKESHDPFAIAATIDGGKTRLLYHGWDVGFHTANVRANELEANFVV